MVRNEADIIELWARYNLRVLDSLHVIDHGSDDNTAHILRQLQAEGLAIELHHWDDPAHTQAEAMRDIARPLAATGKVDYLIPLDADELLATDRHELRRSLLSLPKGHAGAMRWRTYLPEGDELDPFFFRRMRRYRSLEVEELSKMIAPAKEMADYTWSTGSHFVVRETDGQILPSARMPFALAHYPVRSLEQLRRKVMIGAHASRLKADRLLNESWHWLDLEAQLQPGRPQTSGIDLVQIALGYSYSSQAEHIAQQQIMTGPVDAAPGMEQRYRAQPLSLEQVQAWVVDARKTHAVQLAHVGRAQFNAGNAAWRAQDFVLALKRYTDATRLNPDLAVAHLGRARCLSQQGAWDAAQHAFSQVLRIEPSDYSAWLESGHVHRRQDHLSAAVQAYRQAMSAQPSRFEAPLALARVLGQMDHAPESQEAYEKAQRNALGPSAPDRQALQRLSQVHRHMAAYRLEWGDRAGAKQALQAALDAAQRASDDVQSQALRQTLAELDEPAGPGQAGH
jgi:tetratricopeptide (TPR) repeat protein